MTTKIYKTKADFFARENKDENGVSEEFALVHPKYETENDTNKACWNCSDCYDCYDCSDCSGCYGCSRCSRCYDCSDCSDCSGCYGCSRCYDCSDCYGCYDCSDCSDCSDCYDCYDCSDCSGCYGCSRCSRCSGCYGCYDCYDCSDCSGCSGCYGCSDKKGDLVFPIIENIHTEVLEAVTATPDSLKMDSWHTCATEHCRAGWVVTLAGDEGKKLEEKTSTLFAAMQIYKASSPIRVSPVRFFDSNEKAMEDIKRCAQLEKDAV